MEGNYLTAGELALIDQRRGYGYDGCGYGHHRGAYGAATTGIGIGAGLGGGALLLAIAGLWGINQASKARARASEKEVNLVNANLAQMASLQIAETQNRQAALAAERVSRETWQNYHAPTTTQYVDIRTASGSFAGAGSNALAQAEAQIVSNALTGVTQRCPTPVTLYSAPQPCPCPSGTTTGA
jgi:hypothetical protein